MAVTVLYVPYSLDSGIRENAAAIEGNLPSTHWNDPLV